MHPHPNRTCMHVRIKQKVTRTFHSNAAATTATVITKTTTTTTTRDYYCCCCCYYYYYYYYCYYWLIERDNAYCIYCIWNTVLKYCIIWLLVATPTLFSLKFMFTVCCFDGFHCCSLIASSCQLKRPACNNTG